MTDFEAMPPAERLAWYRSRYASKAEPQQNRRHASLDLTDFELLAELPVTPPEEKDAALRELRGCESIDSSL